MMIRFKGVYELPGGMDKDTAISSIKPGFEYKNPHYRVVTGGRGFLLLDDKFGKDSKHYQPRLARADRWQKLHFEPNGILGVLYNMIIEKLFNPTKKLAVIEDELKAKSKPFDTIAGK